jgi:hypothetical protein
MADTLKLAPKTPVSGETFEPYEFAINQQALAFRLSVLTQDFTSFHVLHAQDTASGANPGTDLLTLFPDRGPELIDELLSYSGGTLQPILDAFQTYSSNFTHLHPPWGEDPPPPGGPPSPDPEAVYEWIQQYKHAVIAAVDTSAFNAKALIGDLPNTPAQQAAVEVWALGLRAIAPAAQFSVQQAYQVVDPVPGLPFRRIRHRAGDTGWAISGSPAPTPESWLGDFLGALGTVLVAVGNALADIGRILKKIQ